MYNYFMLIGRVVNDVEIKEVSEGKKVANLTLAVRRAFKNMEGTYDTDFFYISIWEFLAEYVVERIRKGSLIVVKGRMITKKEELANGHIITFNDLVGEKVMFFENEAKVEG